jgi:hypothetical protein
MPICSICDDTGLLNSNSTAPKFCLCSVGKRARRQWEGEQHGAKSTKHSPPSFIDISQLDQVNASVDAMRASLFGAPTSEVVPGNKHPAVQLLYHVAHPGHEVTMGEAAQLRDLAKALEEFWGNMSAIGRRK